MPILFFKFYIWLLRLPDFIFRFYCFTIFIKIIIVILGSIPELPAKTCKEIKASEGEQAVSGKYWFDSIVPREVVLADCNMETEGQLSYENCSFEVEHLQSNSHRCLLKCVRPQSF